MFWLAAGGGARAIAWRGLLDGKITHLTSPNIQKDRPLQVIARVVTVVLLAIQRGSMMRKFSSCKLLIGVREHSLLQQAQPPYAGHFQIKGCLMRAMSQRKFVEWV